MIKEAIVKIVNKQDLSFDEAYAVMNEIMTGQTTATQNAAFLAALSTKSARAETIDEIAGCASAMRDHATKVPTPYDVFEIVGTGGDNAHRFLLGKSTFFPNNNQDYPAVVPGRSRSFSVIFGRFRSFLQRKPENLREYWRRSENIREKQRISENFGDNHSFFSFSFLYQKVECSNLYNKLYSKVYS